LGLGDCVDYFGIVLVMSVMPKMMRWRWGWCGGDYQKIYSKNI